jgi:NADPH oxidase 1
LGVGPTVVAEMTKTAISGRERSRGSWIGSRGNYVDISTRTIVLPKVRIDGPYGAPAEDVFEKEVAVLIGAGIGMFSKLSIARDELIICLGVTPFASILKHIYLKKRQKDIGKLRRVEFIWICKDAPAFGWFQSLLSDVEALYIGCTFPVPTHQKLCLKSALIQQTSCASIFT